MKKRWIAGILAVLVLAGLLAWNYSRGSKLGGADLVLAEIEMRYALEEYTEAIKARDARRLADAMSFPADMDGVVIPSKSGFISRMSNAFRVHIDDIYDLSYEIISIDARTRRAVAEVYQKLTLVGYFGQPVEREKIMFMTFRKVGDSWKVADSGKLERVDNSLLGRILDSALTIPIILVSVLVVLGYVDSKTSY
ncbi:MAG: nuclear transport factor 2 family protein [Firmicutes bacterium]|nr:nuclear transport factor 2 family protein [Bacillota bacterium]